MTQRILHFHFGKEGGAERFFVNLAAAFSKRGIEQQFFIRPNRTWEPDIAKLGPITKSNFRRLSAFSLLTHLQANILVRKWKPDAVMAWMPRAGRLLGRWPNTTKLARMGDFPNNLKHFKHCDVLVGNLPGIANRCYDLGWKKPVITISNFSRVVDFKAIDRTLQNTPEKDFIVTASGRFVPRKGFDTLIKAVAKLSNVTLWLMGEGQEKERLSQISSDLGISEKVKFLGWVEEPIHYIKASNAFVMPSRHEPLGNALLEAWQAKVPTVSTKSEGPTWYMRDKVDGILTEIDDVDQLSLALKNLQDDKSLQEFYVKNATDRLKQMFDEKAVVDAYLKVFQGDFSE
mgnify:FL=1